jgi:hypothetical protein
MNTPWIVGAIFALLWFWFFEDRAFRHPDRQNTLSRFMASIGSKWPLSIGLFMFCIGGLCVHFWWPWCPALMLPGHGG